MRKERTSFLLSPEEMEESAAASHAWEDALENAIRRSDLKAALGALAPDQRAAVLLVDVQGYDYRTSAEILNMREGTLASRLHQARVLLRRALEQEEGFDEARA